MRASDQCSETREECGGASTEAKTDINPDTGGDEDADKGDSDTAQDKQEEDSTLERRRCVCRFLLVPLLGPHGKFTISNLGVESSTNININCRLLFYNEMCTSYFVNTHFHLITNY